MRTDVDMMFCCHSFTCSKVDSLPLLCCCNCRHADSSAGNTLPDSTACTPATEVADHHTHATTTNSALLLLVTAMLVASIHNAYWQESSSTIWCTKPAPDADTLQMQCSTLHVESGNERTFHGAVLGHFSAGRCHSLVSTAERLGALQPRRPARANQN